MIERVIAAIRAEQAKLAHQALRSGAPEGRDAGYLFGRASGMYAGLETALALINQQLAEQEADT